MPLLTFVFFQIEPYAMIEGGSHTNGSYHNGKPKFYGYIPDLLEKLSIETGFEFELHKVAKGSYGYRQGGTWNGMIGEVLNGVSIWGTHFAYFDVSLISKFHDEN